MNGTQRPKRGRPKTLDADKALDVAMQAYWQSDPADVSLNAVCRLAGVSKPALYRQFGGEDGFTRAVLDRYADKVLSEVFGILSRAAPLRETLDALIDFASRDAKMQTGCVFYKMRAGKHRLGPKTLERVRELDAAAVDAHAQYLETRRAAGDWSASPSATVAARYIVEQVGLALTQRAAGEDVALVEKTLTLAFSVFDRP
ncbi:MAG: TetR/AcrR family transcriptional regulator [Pseudomonadota bacterium]